MNLYSSKHPVLPLASIFFLFPKTRQIFPEVFAEGDHYLHLILNIANLWVSYSHRTSSVWLKHGCLIPPLQLCAGNCLLLADGCSPSNPYPPSKVTLSSPFTDVTVWCLLCFPLVLIALFVYPQMDKKAPGRRGGSIPNPDVCLKDWARMIIAKSCVLTVLLKQMVCPGSRYVTPFFFFFFFQEAAALEEEIV